MFGPLGFRIFNPAYLPPQNLSFQIFPCSFGGYFAAPAAPYFAPGGQRKPAGFRIFKPAYLPPLNFSVPIFRAVLGVISPPRRRHTLPTAAKYAKRR